jgi:pimeloyl-ACP methyl ester carboxylesterase
MMNASRMDSLLLSWRKWNRASALTGRDSEIRYVELHDAIVRVKVAGSGPRVLVVTPDPPNVIEHYDALYRMLARDLRIVCYELPGFGHSIPRSRYGFSVEENARVLVDVLERVALVPSIVALSCVAGLSGIMVARQRPDLVSHVVAIQTPSLEEEVRWAARVGRGSFIRTPVVGQLALALGHRAIARAWYRAALGSGSHAPEYTAVALRAFDDGASFSLASGLQALERSRAVLGAVTQPSLAIWGTKDRTHSRTDRRSTQVYLPGAHVVEIDQAGHFPELEQPRRFCDELLAFLT